MYRYMKKMRKKSNKNENVRGKGFCYIYTFCRALKDVLKCDKQIYGEQ